MIEKKRERTTGLVEKKSFCRVCGSACGIVVELDGDRVVKVRGDEDHPIVTKKEASTK